MPGPGGSGLGGGGSVPGGGCDIPACTEADPLRLRAVTTNLKTIQFVDALQSFIRGNYIFRCCCFNLVTYREKG